MWHVQEHFALCVSLPCRKAVLLSNNRLATQLDVKLMFIAVVHDDITSKLRRYRTKAAKAPRNVGSFENLWTVVLLLVTFDASVEHYCCQSFKSSDRSSFVRYLDAPMAREYRLLMVKSNYQLTDIPSRES